MIARIEALRQEAESALASAASEREVDDIRVRFLGRKSEFTALQKKLGDLPTEERPEAGRAVNEAKNAISARVDEALERLKREARRAARAESAVDISLPGRRPDWGTLHPLTRVRQEIVRIFGRMGFRVETGPEVETDFFNFQALGIPKDHPARDMQDTFYLSDEVVLRTHTSPVQIRSMLAHKSPPVRILGIGAVYRRDSDISHSPMFHQVEGLMVEEGISFAHLKGILGAFAREMFGKKTKTRFRPSYFPFTEPSAEVDITCFLCNGKGCRTCGGTGWIEILGSGMVDPVVFQEVQRYAAANGMPCDFDPERVQGFAFGMGIERIAMLKYRIADIRLFFDNDIRFLRQFRGEVG